MKNTYMGTLEEIILEHSSVYKTFDVFAEGKETEESEYNIVWIGYVHNIFDDYQFNYVTNINEANKEIWIKI